MEREMVRQALIWELIRNGRLGIREEGEEEQEEDLPFSGGTPGGEGEEWDALESNSQERVDKALWKNENVVNNVLSVFGDLCLYRKKTVDVLLKLFATKLGFNKSVFESCANLGAKSCLEKSSRQTSLGKEKQRRLDLFMREDSRLIVAFNKRTSGQVVGYGCVTFQVGESGNGSEISETRLVDLQLDPALRGTGLGSHFVKLILKVASFYSMDRVVVPLGDFVSAAPFFEHMGFISDSGKGRGQTMTLDLRPVD